MGVKKTNKKHAWLVLFRLVEIAIVLISISRTHWCIVSLTQLLRAIRASMGPLSISFSKWDYCNFAFVCFASADIGCRSPGSNRFQPKYLSPAATSGLFCSCLLLSFVAFLPILKLFCCSGFSHLEQPYVLDDLLWMKWMRCYAEYPNADGLG